MRTVHAALHVYQAVTKSIGSSGPTVTVQAAAEEHINRTRHIVNALRALMRSSSFAALQREPNIRASAASVKAGAMGAACASARGAASVTAKLDGCMR